MAKQRHRTTKTEQEQKIVHDFMKERNVTDVDPDELTAWAIENGRVERERDSFFRQTKKRLVKAMRGEHYVDPQGREVRKMVAIRFNGEKSQKSLWFEFLAARPKKATIALSQLRRNLVSYARKQKSLRDSYCDNNKYGAELPLFDFNLNKDLREEQEPTEYPDSPPEEDNDQG